MLDPGRHGDGWGTFWRRVGFFFSGCFYATLTLTTAELAFGIGLWGAVGRGSWFARVVQWQYGTWLVAFVGLVVLVVGGQTIYRGLAEHFMKLYPPDALTRHKERVARMVGKAGLTALGMTLGLIGVFVIRAGLYAQTEARTSIGGAFTFLLLAPWGTWLLAAAALGFILYGVHCMFLGVYRQVRSDS